MNSNCYVYFYIDVFETHVPLRNVLISEGFRTADVSHVASAFLTGCDCFITTYDRILRLKDGRIIVMSPIDFTSIKEAQRWRIPTRSTQ